MVCNSGFTFLHWKGIAAYTVYNGVLYQVEVIESSGLAPLFGVGMKQWTDCLLELVWDKIDFCGFLDSAAQLHSVNEMQTEKSNLSAETKSLKVRSAPPLSSPYSRDRLPRQVFIQIHKANADLKT